MEKSIMSFNESLDQTFRLSDKDWKQYSPLTLAYIGDEVYELCIREYLISKKICKVKDLQKEAVKYVSAKAQEYIINNIYEILTEEEKEVYKRGRNASTNTVPKNTDVVIYKKATGFEAVIGYLYLTKQKRRLNDIIREKRRIEDEGSLRGEVLG